MMTPLPSTAQSKQIPAHLRLHIVPASKCPARVESMGYYQSQDFISNWETLRFCFDAKTVIPHECCYFENQEARFVKKDDMWKLDIADWQKLATGETVPVHITGSAAFPSGSGLASLNWIVGVGDRPMTYGLRWFLDFVPSTRMAPQIPYSDWSMVRFPDFDAHGLDPEAEASRLFLYRRWVEETKPAASDASHREVLHGAVIDNLEHLVADVLEQVGGVDEGPIDRISETALGIAMDNRGDFGASATFIGGCHRHFRDDDFCEAEDRATWLPRAGRIIEMLKAAGAVDYFPIIKACAAGEVNELRRLLAAGFPPNFAVYGYSTTLCEAAVGGHMEACQLLLAAGADPNLARPFNAHLMDGGMIFPLQAAHRYPAITKLLLDAGADPAVRGDDDRETPIALRGTFECARGARLIFSKVSFASLRDLSGKTGVHVLPVSHLEFCREFIPESLFNKDDHSGVTPLMQAVWLDNFRKVGWLLEAGASPNQLSSHGLNGEMMSVSRLPMHSLPSEPLVLTPLQLALLCGDYEVLALLLSAGATPREQILQIRKYSTLPSGALREVARRFNEDEKALFPEEADSKPDFVPNSSPCSDFDWLSTFAEARFLRLLCHAPELSEHYEAIVEKLDAVTLARELGVPELCLKAYQAGCPLGAQELLHLALGSIDSANESTAEFEAALQSGDADSDFYGLLRSIDTIEALIDLAKVAISGEAPPKRNLSAAIQSAASGEFDGGAARARQAVQTTGEVEIDDLADALRENLKPGSTVDFGKLLQAARRTLIELGAECATLMRVRE